MSTKLYIDRNGDRLPLLRYCSGNGTQEDGIILHLLSNLADYAPHAVEFGQRRLGGGTLAETARTLKFSLLNMDVEASHELEQIHPWDDDTTWTLFKTNVSPLNLHALFDDRGVPENPAVVVVDVDGMDYWCVLALLKKNRPALLIVEYNCHVPPDISASLAYNPEHRYQRDKNYGASMLAFVNLAASQGYKLVHIHGPLNLYFVDENKVINKELLNVSDGLTNLTAGCLSKIADTSLFYDSFHSGTRPSWFETPDPDYQSKPWIELDRIGDVTQTIKIDDISLEVYSIDKGGGHYNQRGHKEDSVSPLWSLIREKLAPLALIDIGANYGYTTSLLANRLGVKKAIAVEPDPRLARVLKSNLTNNLPDTDFCVVEACVSSAPVRVTSIGLNPSSSQDNRLVAQKNWEMAVVPSVTLSSLIDQIDEGAPLFIKCDTQGFDMDVIKSGVKSLQDRRNWMLRCEFGPYWIESQGFNSIESLAWLCSSFQVFEAPLRTSWKQSFEDVFQHLLDETNAAPFCDYVRKLNHNGMGWLDLYLLPK